MLLVVWIAAHRTRIAGASVAAVIAIAAAIATAAVPGDRGLNARYYATAAADGAPERSTDFSDPAFTRVDGRLDFVRGGPDFPLAFFNDHTRFNFMHMGQPDRRFLEFAVAWTGWWRVSGPSTYSTADSPGSNSLRAGGTRTLYVHAPGGAAQIAVDASPRLVSNPAADNTHEMTLTEGWHRLHVTFSSPYGAPREFSAGELRDGVRVPFDVTNTRTERADGRQLTIARTLAAVKPIADLIALAWLSLLAGLLLLRRFGAVWLALSELIRRRASQQVEGQRHAATASAAMALFVAAAGLEAIRFASPWSQRLRIINAGDDPMTYEGYARDILFNGVLMNGGAPLGQGEPFYYQAFYPYFLAASHALFGEGVFGPIFLQRLLVWMTALALTRIAIRLRGEAIWPVALLVSALFVWWKQAPISADLLNESVYIPLLAVWAAALVETNRTPRPRWAAITGLLGGLTAVARTTVTLSWVFLWPALFVGWGGSRGRARMLTTMIACSLMVLSLIAIRNGLVSHQFVATPTGFAITLRGGNEPPPNLVTGTASRAHIYDRLGIGGHTAEVIEYAISAPRSFLTNLGRKALFALGFYEPYAPGWGYSPVYIAVWLSALAGVWLAVRTNPYPLPALLPLMIAITQYAAVVIVYPKGERLILPIYILLLPYSAIAVYECARLSVRQLLPGPRRRDNVTEWPLGS